MNNLITKKESDGAMPILHFHTRINDHSISFGMVRYSDGKTDSYHKEDAFWRCVISHYCGLTKLAAFEVSISDLTQIKAFCDQAIETLTTDGGRSTEDKE